MNTLRDAQDKKIKSKICSFPIVLREAWNKTFFAPLFLKVSSDSRLHNTFSDLESALEIAKYVILTAFIICSISQLPWPLLCFSHILIFPPKRASSGLFALKFLMFWCWGRMYTVASNFKTLYLCKTYSKCSFYTHLRLEHVMEPM